MEQEYELVLVTEADRDDSDRKNLIEQIKKLIEADKGELVNVDDWGKQPLAYDIKKNTHGFYTLITFRAKPKLPGILSSKLNLMEELLRYLIVKKEDRKLKVKN